MKLAITHSKKVGGAEDYSSEGFSATIGVEVSDDQAQDASAVQAWLKELYDQAKQAVEQQIATVPRRNGGSGGHAASGIFGRPATTPTTGHGPSRPPNGGGQTASPKQISYLVSLGARNRITFADLQRMAQERFQVVDLYQLDKQAASQLIDELKPNGAGRV